MRELSLARMWRLGPGMLGFAGKRRGGEEPFLRERAGNASLVSLVHGRGGMGDLAELREVLARGWVWEEREGRVVARLGPELNRGCDGIQPRGVVEEEEEITRYAKEKGVGRSFVPYAVGTKPLGVREG